jgi:peptide/nickel transport system permease protein
MIFSPGGVESSTWFVLPALTLGIKSGAQVYFFTDEFMEKELGKNYVRTAVAYGYKRSRIYFVFILKNMALPLISFWLLELGSYLAGAAIVEMIYSIPGIGSLLLKALLKYDINLVLIGIFVWVALIIFLIGVIQEFFDRKYAGYMGLKNET